MKFTKFYKALSIIVLGTLIVSCASLGPVYQKSSPPAGKAIIYIYRPSSFVGAAVNFYIWDVTNPIVTKKVTIVYDNGQEYPRIDKYKEEVNGAKNLAKISSGSYYAYTVNPGTYYFMAGGDYQWGIATDFITIVDAKAGNRYFLNSKVYAGGRPYIEKRTVAQGEKEIEGCGLAEKINN